MCHTVSPQANQYGVVLKAVYNEPRGKIVVIKCTLAARVIQIKL